MPSSSGPCIVQVTNVSTAVNKDQLNAFFGFIGNISSIALYPESEDSRFATRVAYVKFNDPESVEIALHLHNTVFNDRALFIQPFGSSESKFPSEKEALAVSAPQGAVFGILPKTKSWPARVVNQVVGQTPNQSIVTIDPTLQDLGLTPYPALTYEVTDTARIEDIRRTIYVSNLDSTITCEKLVSFFSQAGEVRCARMTVFGSDGLRGCYIEFCHQESIAGALTYNGCMFGDRLIRIAHAVTAIERPSELSQSNSRSDFRSENDDSLEEGMRRIRDAQAQISRAVEEELTSPKQSQPSKPPTVQTVSTLANPPPVPVKRRESPSATPPTKSHRRTRSRSRSRSQKRDRHRRRSRSRTRSTSRSRGRRSGKKRDSRSASRDRDRKDRKRSKSRERDRGRSRDEKESSSKSRKKDRDRRDDKDEKRKKDKDDRKEKKKRSRSRSRDRSDKKSSRHRSANREKSASMEWKQVPSSSVKIDYDDEREEGNGSDADAQVYARNSRERNGKSSGLVREEVPMDTSSDEDNGKR